VTLAVSEELKAIHDYRYTAIAPGIYLEDTDAAVRLTFLP